MRHTHTSSVTLLVLLATVLLYAAAAATIAPPSAIAQKRGRAVVCGDPTVRCRTGQIEFPPYNIPFQIPARAIIWETEPFYAIILRSMRVKDEFDECERFIPEEDRLEAQAIFPRNKVFASRCMEPGDLYYTNTDPKQRFMAVYAGRTRAAAAAMLEKVKATGKYPGANLRQMRAGFNGT
ncbi:MAG TPA: hypothetical protein VF240_07700 [Pyrinomonadaceae bacterium]